MEMRLPELITREIQDLVKKKKAKRHMKKLIERKFEINKLPQVGDKEVNGEKLFVQATGVRIKQQRITGEYFFDLDKKFFVAKDTKGNFINGKIVGEYL